MARKVVCAATREYGTSDIFVRIDGKYYKSQEVYDQHKRDKELRRLVIDHICFTMLGYQTGQRFPTLLTKKLQALSFYPLEVVWETLSHESDGILYWMNQKQFDSDTGKVFYIFAVLDNRINDYYKAWQIRNGKTGRVPPIRPDELDQMDAPEPQTVRPGKDISQWLEVDDL